MGKKYTKFISYRLQLIDIVRFLTSSLLNLVNNLKVFKTLNIDMNMMIKIWNLLNTTIATAFLNKQVSKII